MRNLNKNLKPGNKVWAELEVQPNGQLKVKVAKQYRVVNQHLRYWEQINARNFARTLSQSKLVTR